ncbi:hypothetical protein Esi_0099_0012 [Ectocarpus siliculosus]|uniref:Uncharacterized protein n=1 Tax=Ectocarpus siliculosus TaxID=2880 RepID=D8LU85_ECTSI|nr:hypothetical protein Esi_0099_0012 [Ectocarpus siliculosus]|eukprot:CBN75426.1 hypothetical protein Esi_0099_0012 [Ectocarpus siliculosus]
MHSFAGMWHGGAPTLHGQEASRGRTLECAFLSSVAIGGLLSGQPPEVMASHVESAQASAASCRGLSDKHSSSALVLSGMMNLLLPGERSSAAGRRCLDEAEAIFEALPEREPLVAAILTFRRQVESLALIDAATLCPPPRSPPTSSSDGSAPATTAAGGGSSRKPPRKVVAPPRASSSSPEAGGAGASGGDVSSSGGEKGSAVAAASASAAAAGDGEAHTDEGRSILAGVDVVRRDSKCAPLTAQPAHPSFVVADALLLTVRFMRGGGTGGISQLRHVHDFVASELNRLVPARAGALVLISLAGTLLAIKTRLQLTDGMLPMAELTTAMLTKCPGWGRSYGRHAAHLALAVFRLHGHRHSYDTLSDLVRKTSDDPIPSFDDSGGGYGGHACGLGACRVLSESLSALSLPGTGDDAARGGTGGGTVSSSGSRKSSRKRPGEPRPPSSPGGGGGSGGGNADAKRQKWTSSSSKSVSASARKRPAEVSASKPASSTKRDAAVTPREGRRCGRPMAGGKASRPGSAVAAAPALSLFRHPTAVALRPTQGTAAGGGIAGLLCRRRRRRGASGREAQVTAAAAEAGSGIDGGSGGGLVCGASNGGGGGGGGGAKVASVAHTSGALSIRAGGSEGSVGGGGGGGAQPRRPTGRRGNELDFVWELGMLLDEDDAPGDVGRA